jgi:hypothetical protein
MTELKLEIKLFLILGSIQFYKNKIVCFPVNRSYSVSIDIRVKLLLNNLWKNHHFSTKSSLFKKNTHLLRINFFLDSNFLAKSIT